MTHAEKILLDIYPPALITNRIFTSSFDTIQPPVPTKSSAVQQHVRGPPQVSVGCAGLQAPEVVAQLGEANQIQLPYLFSISSATIYSHCPAAATWFRVP